MFPLSSMSRSLIKVRIQSAYGLSLPDKYLRDTADNAPETRSERMFTELEPGFAVTDPATGRRRGLKTAIATVRGWRRAKRAEKRTTRRDDLAA